MVSYFFCLSFFEGFKAKILDKVEANRFGLMARCTKAGGRIIKQMEKED